MSNRPAAPPAATVPSVSSDIITRASDRCGSTTSHTRSSGYKPRRRVERPHIAHAARENRAPNAALQSAGICIVAAAGRSSVTPFESAIRPQHETETPAQAATDREDEWCAWESRELSVER